MKPPAESVQRIGQTLPQTNSTAFAEQLRSIFADNPTGRTFEPKYDAEEPAVSTLMGHEQVNPSPLIIPEGMTARQAADAEKAYYEQQAVPADTEKEDPRARAAVMAKYGSVSPATGGYARLSREGEALTPSERVQTRNPSDSKTKQDFTAYLQKKYPKGPSQKQMVKEAAFFLQGDPETGQVSPVSQQTLDEFLNVDESGKRKKQQYSRKTLRRVDEIDL